MSIVSEFREFAIKGNVVDLAIGVIIGAAFGKIVESLVGDIIMPVIGAITGGLDFSNYYVPLSSAVTGTAMTLEAVRKAGVPVFAWGNFITVLFNFVILAWIIFLMVKGINHLRRASVPPPPAATEPPPPPEDVLLLREIRHALRKP